MLTMTSKKLTAFLALSAASPYQDAFAFAPSPRVQRSPASVRLSAREREGEEWTRAAATGVAAFLTGMGIMAQGAWADPSAVVAPVPPPSATSSHVLLSRDVTPSFSNSGSFETLDFSLPSSYDKAVDGGGADAVRGDADADAAKAAKREAAAEDREAAEAARAEAKKQAEEEKAAQKQAEAEAKEAKKQAAAEAKEKAAEAKEKAAAEAVAKAKAKEERLVNSSECDRRVHGGRGRGHGRVHRRRGRGQRRVHGRRGRGRGRVHGGRGRGHGRVLDGKGHIMNHC